MGLLVAVFLAILIAAGALILAGVYADPIASIVRRRIPSFTYEGDSFLLWGLFALSLLACGTIVIYLLTRP